MKPYANLSVRLASLLAVLSLLGATSAFAADSGAIKRIGIVNTAKLFNDYKGTKETVEKFKQISESKQKERDKMVSELKNLREELSLLNEKARGEKPQAMETKLKALADFDNQVKTELLKERDEQRAAIFQEIETVVNSFAKDKGYDLVIDGQAVLYGVESADLTDPILTILNNRYAKKK